MSVALIEGMEGLGYHSGIDENAAETEIEAANWFLHGWKADSLVQRPVVQLRIWVIQ